MDFDSLQDDNDPQTAMAAKGLGVLAGKAAQSLSSGPPIAEAPMEGVEPEASPIDLVAGAAGSALGKGAADVIGNEVGSINLSSAKSTPIFTTVQAKEAQTAPGAIQRIIDKVSANLPQGTPLTRKTLLNAPNLTPQDQSRLMNFLASKRIPTPMADGGEVSFDSLQADTEPSVVQTPSDSDFDALQDDSEKYGTSEQMAKTFAEGAGRGATFGLSTGLETAAGVDPEAIRARKEANPITSAAGEMAGLVGSSLIPGVGEANLLTKAGEGAVAAAGLAGAETLAEKIGSKAVQMAAETALYQGGDEVSKMLASDPNQTASTAMLDIGLAGLLGGGTGSVFGAVSPLWKAALGTKTAQTLKAVSDRMGGIEGGEANALNDAIEASGLNISPEIRAAMNDDLGLKETFQYLQQGATSAGAQARENLSKFKQSATEQLAGSLGKTSKDIESLGSLSDHQSGEDIKDSLVSSIKQMTDPVSQQFDKIKKVYQNVPLEGEDKRNIIDAIIKMSDEHGYNLSPAAPQAKLISRVLDELPNLNTAKDISKYSSVISDSISNPEMYRVGGQLKRILRTAEDSVVEKTLGKEAPDLLAEHANARSSYKDIMNTIDELNERIHVGRYSGPDSFISALKDMSPEDVVRRLATKSDAGLLTKLQETFPDVAQSIKNYHTDRLLKAAADKASPNEIISAKTLFNQLDKLSPELKSFIISPENQAKIGAIRAVIDNVPKALGPDTARLMDSMGHALPGALGAVLGASQGHAGIGAIIGHLARYAQREGSDAAKLAFLKFMGTSKSIDSDGFKQMVDLIHSTMKGEALLNKGSKALFKAGAEVLSDSAIPTESDRIKIDRRVASLDKSPESLINSASKSAHYMPDTVGAMTQMTGQAVNLIRAAKPGMNKSGFLDSAPVVSPGQKSEYDNVLNLAQQPLLLMQKAKDGILTPKDVKVVQAMYPSTFQRIQSKVIGELINAQSKGLQIPYKTRMGLSLLLGQAVDSTFSPQGIMAAQMTTQTAPPPSQQSQNKTPAASKMKEVSKLPKLYSTANQISEGRKSKE